MIIIFCELLDLKIGEDDMDSLSDTETLNSKCSKDDDSHDEATLGAQVGRMEIGDNFAVITDELENKDPFYVVLCDTPLYTCESTFEDGWENTWFHRDMILTSTYYEREKGGCASGSIAVLIA